MEGASVSEERKELFFFFFLRFYFLEGRGASLEVGGLAGTINELAWGSAGT